MRNIVLGDFGCFDFEIDGIGFKFRFKFLDMLYVCDLMENVCSGVIN